VRRRLETAGNGVRHIIAVRDEARPHAGADGRDAHPYLEADTRTSRDAGPYLMTDGQDQ
jgi:hypothetical protein